MGCRWMEWDIWGLVSAAGTVDTDTQREKYAASTEENDTSYLTWVLGTGDGDSRGLAWATGTKENKQTLYCCIPGGWADFLGEHASHLPTWARLMNWNLLSLCDRSSHNFCHTRSFLAVGNLTCLIAPETELLVPCIVQCMLQRLIKAWINKQMEKKISYVSIQ